MQAESIRRVREQRPDSISIQPASSSTTLLFFLIVSVSHAADPSPTYRTPPRSSAD